MSPDVDGFNVPLFRTSGVSRFARCGILGRRGRLVIGKSASPRLTYDRIFFFNSLNSASNSAMRLLSGLITRFNFSRGIARSDVFRAVPVEGDHIDKEKPFDGWASIRFNKLLHELGRCIGYACMAQDFQALAPRIVHQKERNAVVYGNIARAQQLSVALVVCESQGLRVDDTEKSG